MLALSICSIFLFPYGHPVAAYAFFLVLPSFLSFLSFLQQHVSDGSSYARCDQSNYPSFLLLYVGYSSPPWLISHTIGSDVLLHPSPAPTFENLPCICVLLHQVSKFQHQTKLSSKFSTLLASSLSLSPVCYWKEYSSCWKLLLPLQSLI